MKSIRRRINIVLLADCIKDLQAGAERQIFELAKGLNKEKFSVTIASLEAEGQAPRETIESIGCKLQTYPVKRIYGLSGILKGFSFARFLKREKIDVLVTYHFGSDVWGTVCGKLAGVRTIISNRRDMGFWRGKQHVLAYKLINRWVHKIVVNAEAIKKMVMDEEGVPGEKIDVIPNGVEITEDKPKLPMTKLRAELGLKRGDVVTIHVANIKPVKGHYFLIKAFSRVVTQCPNAKLLLIGEDQLDGEIKALAKKLGIKDNVVFLGKKENARSFLGLADICVLPSLSEGMSNAIMEYMAAAKPVIATKVGGNPELVEDGVTGLLVEKENVKDLEEALLDLIEHKEKRQAMGEKGKRRIENELSIRKMVSNYENILNSFDLGKRRIVHLISTSGLFGAENIVLTLGQNIKSEHHESIICALADTRQKNARIELIEKAKDLGVATDTIKCHGRFDVGSLFRLKKFLIRNRVDILHTHNYKSDIIGALAAKMAGIPVIATAHGFTDVTRSVSFYERLDRWFLKHYFNKVVTVTEKLLSGLSAERRTVISNGIDMEEFKRNDEKRKTLRHEHNIAEGDILIGTVGRLSREKNQKMLLEALYPLMRDDACIKVMIVGAGPKEWELKQFAEARYLTDRIIFTGIMSDTVSAYSAMDIFVLSSLTEGVPLTIIEAMACRVPVVATKVGGIPEMINDGETGALVGARDTDGLKATIENLARNGEKRRHFTAAAHAFVQKNYSLQRMCDAYRQVYNEIL